MRPNVKLVDVQTDMDLSDQVLLKLQDESEVGSDNVIVELPEGEDLEQEESTTLTIQFTSTCTPTLNTITTAFETLPSFPSQKSHENCTRKNSG